MLILLAVAVGVGMLRIHASLHGLKKENRLLWIELGRLAKRIRQGGDPAPVDAPASVDTEPAVQELTPAPPTPEPATVPPPTPEPPAVPSPTLPVPEQPAPPLAARRGSAVVAPAVPPEPREPSPRESRPGIEAFVGGRVLLVVGIVVVLAGLGFLLKLAIDRGWIGPEARIAIGAVAGVAALFGGDRMRGRGFDVFGHALMGGGLGALYLCVYFATVRYEFLGLPAGYAATAALTALGVLLALRRRALLLAYLGFLGGFLAPGLLGWTDESLPTMTAWLVVLDLGVAAVLCRRRWPALDLMALTASVVCFTVWHVHFMVPDRLTTAVACLGLLTAALLVVALVPSLTTARRATTRPESLQSEVRFTSILTALLTGAAAAVGGHILLFPEHRYAFGGGLLLLAGVYALAAWLRFWREDRSDHDAEAFTALGVASLATAIPVIFSGHAVAPALSFAGLAACVIGARRKFAVFGALGAVMIVLAVGDLLFYRMPPHDTLFTPFLNGTFWSFTSPCIAALLAGLAFHANTHWKTEGNLLIGAGLWMYVPVLIFELWQYMGEAYGAVGEQTYGPAAACAAVAFYAAGIGWMARSRPTAAFVLPLGPLVATMLIGIGMIGFSHDRPYVRFANPVFVSAAIIAGAPMVIACFTKPIPRRILVISGLAFLLFAVTGDLLSWAEEARIGTLTREELEFRAQVWVSIAWALYGGGLIALGFVRRRAYLRWAGLIVFGITLAKVVLFDMASLDVVYRIGSFLVLGVLLVGVSFLYQRARKQDEATDQPPR